MRSVLLAWFTFFAVTGCHRDTPPSPSPTSPSVKAEKEAPSVIRTTADEIADEFAADSAKANSKYARPGTVVELRGDVAFLETRNGHGLARYHRVYLVTKRDQLGPQVYVSAPVGGEGGAVLKTARTGQKILAKEVMVQFINRGSAELNEVEINPKNVDLQGPPTAPIEISSPGKLLEEIAADPVAAAPKYLHKPVVFSGRTKSVFPGLGVLTFDGMNFKDTTCVITDDQDERFKALQGGDTVNLQGVVTRIGDGTVGLRGCKLLDVR